MLNEKLEVYFTIDYFSTKMDLLYSRSPRTLSTNGGKDSSPSAFPYVSWKNLSSSWDYKILSRRTIFTWLHVSYLLVIATICTLVKSTIYLPSAGIGGVQPYPPSLSRDAPMHAYCILLPNGCTGRFCRVISPTSRATECIGECWDASQHDPSGPLRYHSYVHV